jgi:hypothetical protein
MKKILLSGALVTLMAVAAQAQVVLTYSRQTRESTLNITFSGGSYYGYGFGGSFGYPGGAFTYYSAGLGVPANGMPMTSPYPLYGPPGSFYSGYGLYSYGTPYGLYGGGYRSPYGRPPIEESLPLPVQPTGAAERMEKMASAKEIEVGRLRFRAGDYKGAVDQFRLAVLADPSGSAQAHFAVALVVTGDFKNADKALRAAAERAPFGKIDFSDLFPSEKEKSRVTAALAKVSGDGTLAAAFALAAIGSPEPLKKAAEKEPLAKKLLP